MSLSMFSKYGSLDVIRSIENIIIETSGITLIQVDLLLHNSSSNPIPALTILLPGILRSFQIGKTGEPVIKYKGMWTEPFTPTAKERTFVNSYIQSRMTIEKSQTALPAERVTLREVDRNNPELDVFYTGFATPGDQILPIRFPDVFAPIVLDILGVVLAEYRFAVPLSSTMDRWIRIMVKPASRRFGILGKISDRIKYLFDKSKAHYGLLSPESFYESFYFNLALFKRYIANDTNLDNTSKLLLKSVFGNGKPTADFKNHSIYLFFGNKCDISKTSVMGNLVPENAGNPLVESSGEGSYIFARKLKQVIHFRAGSNIPPNPNGVYAIGLETISRYSLPLFVTIGFALIGIFKTANELILYGQKLLVFIFAQF